MPSVVNAHLLHGRSDIPDWLRACGYHRLCEVGVREGRHLQVLAGASPSLLLAVDLWANDGILSHNDKNYSTERMTGFYDALAVRAKTDWPFLRLMRGLSLDMAPLVPDGSLDFIYIDADHTYEAIKADIAAWWPKVRPGGTLAGHDYLKATIEAGVTFGVVRAVNEFAASLGITEVHNTAPRERFASWFITKVL